jgi:hypothetical protein
MRGPLSQFSQPTGSIVAAAMVVTVPIIIMVLFFQRRIVAGLTAGAVKGQLVHRRFTRVDFVSPGGD